MSIEKAKEFLIKVSTDEEVGRKVDRAYVDVLLKAAQDHGYDVDESDLSEAVEQFASFGELSETELEAVAGSGIINDSLWVAGNEFTGNTAGLLRLRSILRIGGG